MFITLFYMIVLLFKASWHTHWEPLMLMSSVHLQKFLLGLTNYMQYFQMLHLVTINDTCRNKFFNPYCINILAPEFYISILAQPICKMWITQERKKVALWNKWHFEEKNRECAACLKYSELIFAEKKIYKIQHLEISRTPVLYIGRTVLKG
jgi:hypothetical protein